MSPKRIAFMVGVAAAAAAACSLAVDLDAYTSGGADAATGEGGTLDAASDAPAPPPITGTSCRAIHASAPDAGTGAYTLRVDGGTVPAWCDMETFDGGWTLVTPAMIVEDKNTADISPSSPARVTVTRTTDAHGGFSYAVDVDVVNCGTANTLPSPLHYVRIADLDGYRQLMSTYRFFGGVDCWNLFGSTGGPDVGMQPFDPTVDIIDRQQNMARSDAGAPLPYDGRLQYCDIGPSNFWKDDYAADTRTARVVLRRKNLVAIGGVGVEVDCGQPARWAVSEIYVR